MATQASSAITVNVGSSAGGFGSASHNNNNNNGGTDNNNGNGDNMNNNNNNVLPVGSTGTAGGTQGGSTTMQQLQSAYQLIEVSLSAVSFHDPYHYFLIVSLTCDSPTAAFSAKLRTTVSANTNKPKFDKNTFELPLPTDCDPSTAAVVIEARAVTAQAKAKGMGEALYALAGDWPMLERGLKVTRSLDLEMEGKLATTMTTSRPTATSTGTHPIGPDGLPIGGDSPLDGPSPRPIDDSETIVTGKLSVDVRLWRRFDRDDLRVRDQWSPTSITNTLQHVSHIDLCISNGISVNARAGSAAHARRTSGSTAVQPTASLVTTNSSDTGRDVYVSVNSIGFGSNRSRATKSSANPIWDELMSLDRLDDIKRLPTPPLLSPATAMVAATQPASNLPPQPNEIEVDIMEVNQHADTEGDHVPPVKIGTRTVPLQNMTPLRQYHMELPMDSSSSGARLYTTISLEPSIDSLHSFLQANPRLCKLELALASFRGWSGLSVCFLAYITTDYIDYTKRLSLSRGRWSQLPLHQSSTGLRPAMTAASRRNGGGGSGDAQDGSSPLSSMGMLDSCCRLTRFFKRTDFNNLRTSIVMYPPMDVINEDNATIIIEVYTRDIPRYLEAQKQMDDVGASLESKATVATTGTGGLLKSDKENTPRRRAATVAAVAMGGVSLWSLAGHIPVPLTACVAQSSDALLVRGDGTSATVQPSIVPRGDAHSFFFVPLPAISGLGSMPATSFAVAPTRSPPGATTSLASGTMGSTAGDKCELMIAIRSWNNEECLRGLRPTPPPVMATTNNNNNHTNNGERPVPPPVLIPGVNVPGPLSATGIVRSSRQPMETPTTNGQHVIPLPLLSPLPHAAAGLMEEKLLSGHVSAGGASSEMLPSNSTGDAPRRGTSLRGTTSTEHKRSNSGARTPATIVPPITAITAVDDHSPTRQTDSGHKRRSEAAAAATLEAERAAIDRRIALAVAAERERIENEARELVAQRDAEHRRQLAMESERRAIAEHAAAQAAEAQALALQQVQQAAHAAQAATMVAAQAQKEREDAIAAAAIANAAAARAVSNNNNNNDRRKTDSAGRRLKQNNNKTNNNNDRLSSPSCDDRALSPSVEAMDIRVGSPSESRNHRHGDESKVGSRERDDKFEESRLGSTMGQSSARLEGLLAAELNSARSDSRMEPLSDRRRPDSPSRLSPSRLGPDDAHEDSRLGPSSSILDDHHNNHHNNNNNRRGRNDPPSRGAPHLVPHSSGASPRRRPSNTNNNNKRNDPPATTATTASISPSHHDHRDHQRSGSGDRDRRISGDNDDRHRSSPDRFASLDVGTAVDMSYVDENQNTTDSAPDMLSDHQHRPHQPIHAFQEQLPLQSHHVVTTATIATNTSPLPSRSSTAHKPPVATATTAVQTTPPVPMSTPTPNTLPVVSTPSVVAPAAPRPPTSEIVRDLQEQLKKMKAESQYKSDAITTCGQQIVSLRQQLRHSDDQTMLLKQHAQELDHIDVALADGLSKLEPVQLRAVVQKYAAGYRAEKKRRKYVEERTLELTKEVSKVRVLQQQLATMREAHIAQAAYVAQQQAVRGSLQKYKVTIRNQELIIGKLESLLEEAVTRQNPVGVKQIKAPSTTSLPRHQPIDVQPRDMKRGHNRHDRDDHGAESESEPVSSHHGRDGDGGGPRGFVSPSPARTPPQQQSPIPSSSIASVLESAMVPIKRQLDEQIQANVAMRDELTQATLALRATRAAAEAQANVTTAQQSQAVLAAQQQHQQHQQLLQQMQQQMEQQAAASSAAIAAATAAVTSAAAHAQQAVAASGRPPSTPVFVQPSNGAVVAVRPVSESKHLMMTENMELKQRMTRLTEELNQARGVAIAATAAAQAAIAVRPATTSTITAPLLAANTELKQQLAKLNDDLKQAREATEVATVAAQAAANAVVIRPPTTYHATMNENMVLKQQLAKMTDELEQARRAPTTGTSTVVQRVPSIGKQPSSPPLENLELKQQISKLTDELQQARASLPRAPSNTNTSVPPTVTRQPSSMINAALTAENNELKERVAKLTDELQSRSNAASSSLPRARSGITVTENMELKQQVNKLTDELQHTRIALATATTSKLNRLPSVSSPESSAIHESLTTENNELKQQVTKLMDELRIASTTATAALSSLPRAQSMMLTENIELKQQVAKLTDELQVQTVTAVIRPNTATVTENIELKQHIVKLQNELQQSRMEVTVAVEAAATARSRPRSAVGTNGNVTEPTTTASATELELKKQVMILTEELQKSRVETLTALATTIAQRPSSSTTAAKPSTPPLSSRAGTPTKAVSDQPLTTRNDINASKETTSKLLFDNSTLASTNNQLILENTELKRQIESMTSITSPAKRGALSRAPTLTGVSAANAAATAANALADAMAKMTAEREKERDQIRDREKERERERDFERKAERDEILER
jgi:hypothetical protein